MAQRFTESTIRDPQQLTALINSLAGEIERSQQQIATLTSQASRPRLTASDMAAVRDALQALGPTPLNVANLKGILAQSQRGFGVIAATSAALPSAALYEVGTFGIVTGPPVAIYYVAEGTPRSWTAAGITSGAPANMMTTDTNQTPGATVVKTWTAQQILNGGATLGAGKSIIDGSGLLTQYNSLAAVGMGLPPIIALTKATAQTAAVGATTLYAVPASGAGVYRVSYYIYLTTLGNNVNLNMNIGWSDGVGGYTDVSSTVVCNAPGYAQRSVTLRSAASQNITFSTSLSGAIGAGVYAFDVVLEKLSAV